MASNAELTERVKNLEGQLALYEEFFQSVAQQLDLEVNASRDEVQAAITTLTEDTPTDRTTVSFEDDGTVRLLVRLNGTQYTNDTGEEALRHLLETSALNVESVELIV